MSDHTRRDEVIRLTSHLMHKHYCENDVEALASCFTDDALWLGAGENEYASGGAKIAAIFRSFAGKIPPCLIENEEYEAIEISPDSWLCMGRCWISTDPATGISIRVHQRISMIFRYEDGAPRCCHIHNSNPYAEMVEGDVGFPTHMARQSYEYLQERIAEQKRKIESQSQELADIYNTVPCGILRLLLTQVGYRVITFNHAMATFLGKSDGEVWTMDWSRGFATNALEEDVEVIEKTLACLRKPGDMASVDYRIRSKDGRWTHLNSTFLRVDDVEEGAVVQMIAFDITKRVELEMMLESRSFEDSLTGLWNRNRYTLDSEELVASSVENLAFAIFDLNGLKSVNDRLGHRAGDELIRRTASHIESYFPDRTYRIGGDEFVVIDSQISQLDFESAIGKLIHRMEGEGIMISYGTSYRSGNCSLKEQFHEADLRMYETKKNYYRIKA